MIHVGDDGHVPDVLLLVHHDADLVYREVHLRKATTAGQRPRPRPSSPPRVRNPSRVAPHVPASRGASCWRRPRRRRHTPATGAAGSAPAGGGPRGGGPRCAIPGNRGRTASRAGGPSRGPGGRAAGNTGGGGWPRCRGRGERARGPGWLRTILDVVRLRRACSELYVRQQWRTPWERARLGWSPVLRRSAGHAEPRETSVCGVCSRSRGEGERRAERDYGTNGQLRREELARWIPEVSGPAAGGRQMDRFAPGAGAVFAVLPSFAAGARGR